MTTNPAHSQKHPKRRYKTYVAYEDARWAARSGPVKTKVLAEEPVRVSTNVKRRTCKTCHRPGNVWFKTASGDYVLAQPDAQGRILPSAIDPCFRKETGRYDRAIRANTSKWRLGKSPSSYG